MQVEKEFGDVEYVMGLTGLGKSASYKVLDQVEEFMRERNKRIFFNGRKAAPKKWIRIYLEIDDEDEIILKNDMRNLIKEWKGSRKKD